MKSPKFLSLFPIALVFYEIVTYLSNDMYLPSLPTLVSDFGTTENIAQYTLLSWFLGSASIQLLMGPLADRFGRRVVLLTGGVFFILTTLLCAVTQSTLVMLIARFIQGSTVCSVVVAGYAAVHESYDTVAAIKIISIMAAVTFLAPAFGPLIGAIIIELSHWRMIFFLLAFLAIIGVAALFWVMPETNPQSIRINVKEVTKDYLSILKNRSFLTFILPLCFLWISLIGWLVGGPFILIEDFKLSLVTYGIMQLCVSGGFMLGAQFTHMFMRVYKPLKIIGIGLTFNLIPAIGLLLSKVLSLGLYANIFLIAMLSLGTAIVFGPLNRLAIEVCDEPMGRRMAVSSSCQNFFAVLAIVLAELFQKYSLYGLSALVAMSAIMAFCLFVYFIKNTPSD